MGASGGGAGDDSLASDPGGGASARNFAAIAAAASLLLLTFSSESPKAVDGAGTMDGGAKGLYPDPDPDSDVISGGGVTRNGGLSERAGGGARDMAKRRR